MERFRPDAISVVIPRAKTVERARGNLGAAALSSLSPNTMARIRLIYEARVNPSVRQRW